MHGRPDVTRRRDRPRVDEMRAAKGAAFHHHGSVAPLLRAMTPPERLTGVRSVGPRAIRRPRRGSAASAMHHRPQSATTLFDAALRGHLARLSAW